MSGECVYGVQRLDVVADDRLTSFVVHCSFVIVFVVIVIVIIILVFARGLGNLIMQLFLGT